jgi:hypothetical protein
MKANYVYPVGDFLSGFSDDEKNPCDYELECQRMVIRGVQYLDENPDIMDLINAGGVSVFDEPLRPMIEFMCENPDSEQESYGQTGGMVSHTVVHSYQAKKMGWETYIKRITEKEETEE